MKIKIFTAISNILLFVGIAYFSLALIDFIGSNSNPTWGYLSNGIFCFIMSFFIGLWAHILKPKELELKFKAFRSTKIEGAWFARPDSISDGWSLSTFPSLLSGSTTIEKWKDAASKGYADMPSEDEGEYELVDITLIVGKK